MTSSESSLGPASMDSSNGTTSVDSSESSKGTHSSKGTRSLETSSLEFSDGTASAEASLTGATDSGAVYKIEKMRHDMLVSGQVRVDQSTRKSTVSVLTSATWAPCTTALSSTKAAEEMIWSFISFLVEGCFAEMDRRIGWRLLLCAEWGTLLRACGCCLARSQPIAD